jgi:hypothetical protein
MGAKTATNIALDLYRDNNVLPPMGVNPDTITMAGASSGSYMTNHMTVIHSERIKGSGMMEGGPYHDGLIFDQN